MIHKSKMHIIILLSYLFCLVVSLPLFFASLFVMISGGFEFKDAFLLFLFLALSIGFITHEIFTFDNLEITQGKLFVKSIFGKTKKIIKIKDIKTYKLTITKYGEGAGESFTIYYKDEEYIIGTNRSNYLKIKSILTNKRKRVFYKGQKGKSHF